MKRTLTLVTFNTGLAQINLAGYKLDLVPNVHSRLESIIDEIAAQNADIVFLQEVFKRSHREEMYKELLKQYPFAYTNTENEGLLMSQGLLILSKIEMNIVKRLRFKARGAEKVTGKGALIVRPKSVQYEDLIFANVHFPYGGFGSKSQISNKSIKLRDRCIEQLLNEFDKNDMVCLAGDFNFGSDISQQNYESMKTYGYVSKNDKFVTWDPANPLNFLFKKSLPQKIDNLFISKSLNKFIDYIEMKRIFDEGSPENSEGYLSDHYGLKFTFSLKS